MKQIFVLHAEVCKVLANPIRIEIINTLRGKEMSVSTLLSKLKLKKANLSQHLAVMRSKGIVIARRDGLTVHYKIADPKVIKACDLMREVLIGKINENKDLLKQIKG